MRRALRVVVVLAVLSVAAPARAVEVGLGLGGGYWFEGAAQFDLNVRVQQYVGKVVAFGIRPGVLLNIPVSGGQVSVGLPIDATIRFRVRPVYFDLTGGLTIIFGYQQPFRPRVAGGIGFLFGKFALGVEAGWLLNGAQLTARFTYTF